MLPNLAPSADGRVSEELCASASVMANALGASAIFVYTRRGYMANFLSRCRPDCPIFAFTGAPIHCMDSSPDTVHICPSELCCSEHMLQLLRHVSRLAVSLPCLLLLWAANGASVDSAEMTVSCARCCCPYLICV